MQMRPILPIAAPAASGPAAKPCRCFFCFSCFSTGVALVWENRRKRQEQASDSGTPFVGNQSGDSDGSAECKTESKFVPLGFFRELKHPGLFSLAYFQSPKAGGSHAYEDRRTCNCRGRQLVPDEQPTHTQSVDKEGNRADDHDEFQFVGRPSPLSER